MFVELHTFVTDYKCKFTTQTKKINGVLLQVHSEFIKAYNSINYVGKKIIWWFFAKEK